MRKFLFVIAIMILFTSFASADGYTEKLKVKGSLTQFSSFIFKNPATKKYLYKESFWEINSKYKFDNKSVIVQDGDKSSAYLFNTHSYLKKSDKLYYGDLRYRTGKKYNVKWCESSDYKRLSPYVIADSIGGDMNFEEYYFHGGFSKDNGSINYGFEAFYRAKYEYRLVNPRPKNIVSEYGLVMGLSFDLLDKHVLGFDLRYSNYKQDNEIKMFKNGEMQRFFIMKGLGYYNLSFSKSYRKLQVFHDIESLSASMQFFSKERDGLFANLSYKQSTLDQYLGDFNDLNMSQLRTYYIGADIGYSFNTNLYSKIYSSIENHSGYENVHEHLNSINYRLVTVYNNYKSMETVLGNSYLFFFDNKEQNMTIDFSYKKSKQEYRSTKSFQDISNIKAMISYGVCKKSFFTEVFLGYSKNISSELILADKMFVPNIKDEMILPNYKYLSSNKLLAGLTVNYNYRISIDKSLFFKGDYKMEYVENNDLYTNIELTAGIRF